MNRQHYWLVGSALFFLTLAFYWPVTVFPFVNFDDPWYVVNNTWVLNGLSWSGIKWGLTTTDLSNWHPLTMWSYMLDDSLYGLFAGGYHLTNILFHAANAVLLWLVLTRLTGWFWSSALVAALFAWHPMNVESVAWIAERKNVLSTFFFILTIGAYVNYVKDAERGRSVGYYMLALVLFALGLAAKSMLVTLPCVLLLLDFWPLRRISSGPGWGLFFRQRKNWLLLFEKIPFFLLTAADSAISYWAQHKSGAVSSLAGVPFQYRLANVPVAYAGYLSKVLCPVNLCVFYPFPETLHATDAVFTLVLLVAITLIVWHWRAKFPWLLVGWLWFLGTLVPVIGLVQIGAQKMADRYAYLPLIGLFLMFAGSLESCGRARPQYRRLISLLAGGILCCCLVLTSRQLMYWQDSVALFGKVVEVSPEDATVHNFFGRALAGGGQSARSIEQYAAAVRLRPEAQEYQYDLGCALIAAHRYEEAETNLAGALRQIPDNAQLHNTRGVALMLDHKLGEAQAEFTRAIALQPDNSSACFNLGKVLLTQGQNQEAITNFNLALRQEPDWPEALENMAGAYAAGGDLSNAVATAGAALKKAQDDVQPLLADRIAAELKTYQNAVASQSSAPHKN